MTELERALLHIKTRADAWAVKEVEKALSQEPCDDDLIRRDAVFDGLKGCICEEWVKTLFATMVKQLPPVTQRPIECDDAISRDMALEKMADYVASGYADSAEDFEEYSRIICQLPPVTQKAGKWIDIPFSHYFKCSECDKYQISATNYCPNCGCRMIEPQERSKE